MAVELRDIKLFEHLVIERRQSRANERVYNLDYLMLTYWMAWSLWDGSLATTSLNFKKRLGYDVDYSTLSKAIARLKLRPPERL